MVVRIGVALVCCALSSIMLWAQTATPTPKVYSAPIQPEDRQGLNEITRVADGAHKVVIASLKGRCDRCDSADLVLRELPRLIDRETLSVSNRHELAFILSKPQSYELGVEKPCAGYFRYAVKFIDGDNTAVLLVMPSCRWGRLVENQPVPFYLYNFAKDSWHTIQTIAPTLRDEQ